MIEKLKSFYNELEEKIKEKTQDLSQKVNDLEEARSVILNILEDVEEEKEITAQEKEKIETILHSIGDGVFVIDSNMNIIMFNQVAADISGFTINEAIGKKYREILRFISEKDGEINDRFIGSVMENGETQNMEDNTLLVRKDGKTIPVADSASPLKNKEGKIIGCVVVFRDSSREREIDKAKTEFVSLASHQLRTPLTAINWYTEMLLSGDAGEITKDQEEFLNQIYSGNQRMVELVNSLLNVSRIDLGTFAIEPEPVRLNEICDSVLMELKPSLNKKNLEVVTNYDKIPLVSADKNLIRIVFQNLLSNATKYTPEGGKIEVSIDLKGENVIIKVADNGFGIPRGQHENIFKKLFRADNVRDKNVEGTGLGLYIIKKIIEASGGKIRFESEENKGTTFFVEIPLSGMIKKEGTKGLS